MEILEKLRSLLPEESYAVGGFVRDYLLGKNPNDIDLIVKTDNLQELAHKIAKALKGHLFGFKKENLPVRGEVYSVVLPNGLRMDITSFEDLYRDLSSRDFTINALAVRVGDINKNGFSEKRIIDLFGGLSDLKKRTIRALSKENLISDPLRLLRAFRLAAELDFDVDPPTREMIKELSPLIKKSAKERIISEILKALSSPNFIKFLRGTGETYLLKHLFGIEPRQLKDFIIFARKVNEMVNDENLKKLKKGKKFLGEFDENTAARFVPFVIFTPPSEDLFSEYPFGEEFQSYITKGIKGFKEFERLNTASILDMYRFLKKYEDVLFIVGVLSKIHGLENKLEKLLKFYTERFKNYSQPLLNGREVMNLLGLNPSPKVGKLLEKLIEAQLEGKVKTKDEARRFLFSIKENI